MIWDAERINEVTGNLLSNAFKFTPVGGTIELTAEPAGDRPAVLEDYKTIEREVPVMATEIVPL